MDEKKTPATERKQKMQTKEEREREEKKNEWGKTI